MQMESHMEELKKDGWRLEKAYNDKGDEGSLIPIREWIAGTYSS